MLAVKDLVKLGDCCELNPCAPQNLPNILYSFVPMSAIGINGEIDNSEYRKLEDLKGGYSYFINGDVLFAKITPCMENGKGAVALNLKNNIGFGSTEFHVLRPKTNVISSYWLYLLTKTDKFRQAAEKSMTGSAGQKRVPISFIRNYQIALPIITEQHRIEKIIYKINEILGFLEKKLNKFNMLINSRFMEMFGNAVLNDKHWDVKPLLQLSSLITNGNTPAGGSENYVSTGVMFLRSQNIWRKTIDLKDIVFIDQKTHENLKRSNLQNKDILITKTGRINTENSSLGRAAIFYGKNGSANINGHVYLVRIKGTVLPEFVLEILTSEEYRDYIRKVCVGGIDKRQINLEHVEQFPIILPPIDLQNQFVSFIKKIDKSKLAVQKSIEQLEILKKSLMQEYFG